MIAVFAVLVVLMAIACATGYWFGYRLGYQKGRYIEVQREMAERRIADIDTLRKEIFE